MLYQLRTYRVQAGAMDEFVALWRDHIVPARRKLGYEVVGGWNDPQDGTFVWLVGHEAPDGWEVAERTYYESDERAALPRDPKELLEDVQTKILRPAG